MMNLASSIGLLFLLIDPSVPNPYCKMCKKDSHTLCRYKEGPSDNCVDYKKNEFSIDLQEYIVDIHNDIRNHVATGQETRGAVGRQPSAANINALQWDRELADIAQRWADQCIGLHEEKQHDLCRTTDRFEVGQNVLTAVTATADVPEIALLILNWYKQVENVLPADIENFLGIQRGKFLIGQYTQLVWAETRFVGCGMSTFRNRNFTDQKEKYLHRLVCNYGPRGNLIGSPVYIPGVPCSKCPFGSCDSVRTGLCKGLEQQYTPMVVFGERKTPPHVVDSLSLGFILKNNLTKVIDSILKQVDVRLGPSNNKNDKTNEVSHNAMILLARNGSQWNLHEPEGQNDFQKALKSISNILAHYGTFSNIHNKHIFDLEEGRVIVDDCKHQMQECQYEEDEITSKTLAGEDIVLPNNMVYRKFEGIWFLGRCRSIRDPATLNWIRILGDSTGPTRYYDGDTCHCLYRLN